MNGVLCLPKLQQSNSELLFQEKMGIGQICKLLGGPCTQGCGK